MIGAKTGKVAKRDAKATEIATTDEEEDAEIEEVEELMGAADDAARSSSPVRPKLKPRTQRRQRSVSQSDDENGLDAFGEEVEPVSREQPVTPKAKPRPRPVRKVAKATPQPATRSSTRSPSSHQVTTPKSPKSPSLSEPPTTPEPDAETTPTVKRKRARSPENDDEEPVSPQVEQDAELPEASQEIHMTELKVKRKRIRH